MDFTSIAYDGSTAGVTLRGMGLVEGQGTIYTFGSVSVTDLTAFDGPNVYGGFLHDNDAANLTLPTNGAFYGSATVTTAGGTSAPFTVGYTGLASVAASGTPANAVLASANPGQVVTVQGCGPHLGTDLLWEYMDGNGTQAHQLLNPQFVNAEGTEAQFTVPLVNNGARRASGRGHVGRDTAGGPGGGQLQHLLDRRGAVAGPRVPGRERYDVPLRRRTAVDANFNDGPDVFGDFLHDNDAANLGLPVGGFGTYSVTTAGGTSAPQTWNVLYPGLGDLRDLSRATAAGELWVATLAGELRRVIDHGPDVGYVLPLPGGASSGVGLVRLPEALNLRGGTSPRERCWWPTGTPSPIRSTQSIPPRAWSLDVAPGHQPRPGGPDLQPDQQPAVPVE